MIEAPDIKDVRWLSKPIPLVRDKDGNVCAEVHIGMIEDGLSGPWDDSMQNLYVDWRVVERNADYCDEMVEITPID